MAVYYYVQGITDGSYNYMLHATNKNKQKYKKFQHENNLLRCPPHSREYVITISCYRNETSEYYIILYLGMSVASQTTATAKLYDNNFYSVRCMYIIMHFNLAHIDKIQ